MATAKQILDVVRSWIGMSRASQTHRPIIDIYNSHSPLARGYAVTYWDDYCDATVSAAFIQCNAVSAIGSTECGVPEHIAIFRNAGIWKGRTKPSSGWILTFDWNGDGVADHIGFVESISGDTVTTIEGNMSGGYVGRRTIAWNDGCIYGYAAPKYSAQPKEDKFMFSVKEIEKGAKGQDVRLLQQNLRGRKITDDDGNEVKVDGKFGDKTEQALIKFQKKMGFDTDLGCCGKNTWKRLLRR